MEAARSLVASGRNAPQRGLVRHDPGFHAGRHEEDLLIHRSSGFVPLVAAFEMIPGLFEAFHRIFAVHQHRDVGTYLSAGVGGLEIIENRPASTTGAQSGHSSRQTRFLYQFPEALTAANLILF